MAASALLIVAGLALEDGLEVRAVVAHGPVAAAGAGERVMVEVRVGEPRQVPADLRGLGPAGLGGERSCGEGADVRVEQCGEGAGKVKWGASVAPAREGGRVL
jgi:hypothetical protein